MCSDGSDLECTAFRIEVRRAKKRHRCHECRVDILPGELYARAAWVGDDGWASSNRCALCHFLCEAIETLICGDHGLIPWGGGFMLEELHEVGAFDSDEYPQFAWAGEAYGAIRDRVFEARP
jgi:hypothetical protein